jgi:predicted ribosome quality control (RQC) complex YloA/Tae2 family protein
MISVNPSLPLMYLTERNSASPLKAPAFCMLLRKHLQNGRITAIEQPSLERILHFHIEHFNEMGDLCTSILTVELMGKHSNIIFRDEEKIMDSIKHVSAFMSSVREVLLGREYFIPFEGDKADPLTTSNEEFIKLFQEWNLKASRSIRHS